MAAPTLTVIKTNHLTGNNLTTGLVSATSGGDSFVNTGVEFFIFNNASASPITATFAITQTVDGQTPPARTLTIPANTIIICGSFPTGVYNDASGNMNVTYSAVTSLKVGAYSQGS